MFKNCLAITIPHIWVFCKHLITHQGHFNTNMHNCQKEKFEKSVHCDTSIMICQVFGINLTAQLCSVCLIRHTACSREAPLCTGGASGSRRSVTRCHTASKPSRLSFSSIAFTRCIICPHLKMGAECAIIIKNDSWRCRYAKIFCKRYR